MGIIVNNGYRRPTVLVSQLDFAEHTPYETRMGLSTRSGDRVMAEPVALALKSVLAEVVESGTARRLAGAFKRPNGQPIKVGGKTGSGDNEFKTLAPSGAVISSLTVNRTATFVFYVGERYFGVLTAFVDGKKANQYRFTSALPVAIVKLLAPAITSKLNAASLPAEAKDIA
jgi:membrane peptidoglycan carboxypeptidase